MKHPVAFAFVALAIAAASVPASAQSAPEGARDVYLFAGALRSNSGDGTVAGGGGERIARSGMSLGGDVTWFKQGAEREFTNDRMLAASLNVGYHFGRKTNDSRWNAFVSGGPAVLFAVGTGFGLSFGYGANVWMTRHVGIRGEVSALTPLGTDMQRLTSLRVGVTLR